MNNAKFNLKMFLLGVAVFIMATAAGLGWYFRNGVFIGPYSLPNLEGPVYFEFPVMASFNEGYGNTAFMPGLHELAYFNKVAVYGIDPVSLLTVRPYPLSKSFPDPLSMRLNFLDYGPIQKAQFAAIGPKGNDILNWLIEKDVLEDVSSTEVRLVGRNIRQHMVLLGTLTQEYYLPTLETLQTASLDTSIDDVQKIIDAQPKHPQYWLNRAQLALYRLASGYAWLISFNQVLWSLAGVLAFIWLWAFKTPFPLLIWWVIQAVYAVSWRLLYQYSVIPWALDHGRFWSIFIAGPFLMYSWPAVSTPLPRWVCAAEFVFIGPVIIVYMGWVFLTKHLIPKQKRLFEDFLKFDKDKEKKQDLNITDVEFKVVRYDLKKKLEEYREKSEFFLGLDDNEMDVSVPEEIANHNFHCMGPIGSGNCGSMFENKNQKSCF